MALRNEAEQWLQTVGTDQWSDAATASRALKSWQENIDSGMTWVVVNELDSIIATATRSVADRDFWRAEDSPESALYLSKIIVSRRMAGQNIGGLILDWASQLAALEARNWVRLDVWRTNTNLHTYYKRHGFRHVRTEAPSHRLSGWLGQRPAGTVLFPEMPLVPTHHEEIPDPV
ncbi:GNAT family N-acetyltransferase [Embleya sp. NPDC059237]|uniref:GNAT family N-acetyltransferase n=1 Tax=Embleya sp. NPDC059237 TaxID=3346784 RepID=UPI0036B53713